MTDNVGVNRDQETTNHHQHAENETERTEIIRTSHSNQNSEGANYGPQKPKRDCVDYGTLGSLIAAFLAACYLGWQTNRTLIAQVIAEFNAERAILAFDPADWEMSKTFEQTRIPIISFKIKNTGKNPAHMIQGTYEFWTARDFRPDIPTSIDPQPIIGMPAMIGQDTKVAMRISDLDVISQDELHNFQEGKLFLFSRFIFFYQDNFICRYEFRITSRYRKMIGPNGGSENGFEFPEIQMPLRSVEANAVISQWADFHRESNNLWKQYNDLVLRSEVPDPITGRCPLTAKENSQ